MTLLLIAFIWITIWWSIGPWLAFKIDEACKAIRNPSDSLARPAIVLLFIWPFLLIIWLVLSVGEYITWPNWSGRYDRLAENNRKNKEQ